MKSIFMSQKKAVFCSGIANRILVYLAILIMALVLAACGGDSGGDAAATPEPTPEPPPPTTVSTIIYVRSVDGNDSNPGTQSEPKLTIEAGYLFATQEVRVAAGTYNVNSDINSGIGLREGVSLFGGYSPGDWNVRDPATHVTTIQNIGTGGAAASQVIFAGGTITTVTVVDGFTITGGGAFTTTKGINVSSGSPTIRNNIINGGNSSGSDSIGIDLSASSAIIDNNTINGGTAGDDSIGIDISGTGSPMVTNNTINGGSAGSALGNIAKGIDFSGTSASGTVIANNTISGGSGNESYGIYVSISSPTIRDNTIDGGDGASVSRGVYISSASPKVHNNLISGGGSTSGESHATFVTGSSSAPFVRNNTISGGTGFSGSAGLLLQFSARGTFENNVLFTGGSSALRFCIFELTSSADPAALRNNDLFDCPDGLYFDVDGGGALTAIAAVEADLLAEGIPAGGNISVDPLLADVDGTDNDLATMEDNDWHFSVSAPTSVTQGGQDLSTEFTTDKDGNTRTVPWSMGAYEAP